MMVFIKYNTYSGGTVSAFIGKGSISLTGVDYNLNPNLFLYEIGDELV